MQAAPTVQQLEDAKREGTPVSASDGAFIGEVEAIYYDTETRQPKWIGVRSGFLPSRRVLVPVQGAVLEGSAIRAACTKDDAESAPPLAAEELSPEDEERLYAHYGVGRPAEAAATVDVGDAPGVVRHEEELVIGRRLDEIGTVRARKVIDTEHVSRVVAYDVEHATIERVPANDDDSGLIETLPDGSISIPVLEEEIVVEKEIVVRERVIISKERAFEAERIEADLRVERVDVDLGPGTESVLEPPEPAEAVDEPERSK